MKFQTLKKFKKIISFSGLIAIVGGSVSIPIIYNVKNEKIKKKKAIQKIKKVKEIKRTKFKNKLLKNKNEIFKVMNNIASNEKKWNNLKKIIVENIDFEKEKFSSSKVNTNKLDLNYKINNFEGITNILYVIDKWEVNDGKIKIFGHIKKNNWKVTIKPFLVDGFLTKKQNNIKKLEVLNSSWIKSIITVNQDLEKYLTFSKEDIKNTILFYLQNQNILNTKIKIQNFVINKNIGKLSFKVEIYYLKNKFKTISVIYDNLEKDLIDEIKSINSYYLEENIFNFFKKDNYIDYKKIDLKNYLSLIKELDLIKKNKVNVFLNNQIFNVFTGELSFEIKISKKGHKTHIVKMFYNNFLKKLSSEQIKNFEKEIKNIDGIIFTKDNSFSIKFTDKNETKIKNYFKKNYPNWNFKVEDVKRFNFNVFKYELHLSHKKYVKHIIRISYQIFYFIELKREQLYDFGKYIWLERIKQINNEVIKNFLKSNHNQLKD